MKTQRKSWLEEKLKKLRLLESYHIERTNETIAKELGISPHEIVKLNYNENMYLPKETLFRFMREAAEESDPRIYPQEEENKLKEKISNYLKVPENSIVVGNGSDELIDRTIRFFIEKGDRAIAITPTFPIFEQCLVAQGGKHIGVPLLRNFDLDVNELTEAFLPKASLLYVCSPNNPTGNQFNIKDIITLIEEFPDAVIIDEAYGEYADYSTVPLLDKCENLIILRTFSKAFGLAGLRLGYAVTNPKIAQILKEKTTSPFPVSVFTLNMGRKLLENFSIVEKTIAALKTERAKLIKNLNKINGIQAFDSKTDFVLFNTEKPYDTVYQKLLKRAILIKKFGKILHLNNCLRTTVGLPEMNTKLLDALEEISR